MPEMTVKTDPVLEAIAKKLHGIERVPLEEQAAMIRRAASAARAAAQREAREEMCERCAEFAIGYLHHHDGDCSGLPDAIRALSVDE